MLGFMVMPTVITCEWVYIFVTTCTDIDTGRVLLDELDHFIDVGQW